MLTFAALSDASHARHVDEQARLPEGSRAAEVG